MTTYIYISMTLTTKQLNQLIYSSSLPWFIQDRLVSKTLLLWIKSNPRPFMNKDDLQMQSYKIKYTKRPSVYYIKSPFGNYPMHINTMWLEELRAHCREVTGKKRLKKSLSRHELIHMIIKA